MNHLRSGVGDQSSQHDETLSLLKIPKKKKITQSWWLAPEVPVILEDEAGESLEPRRGGKGYSELRSATELQPGQQRETPSPKKEVVHLAVEVRLLKFFQLGAFCCPGDV